MKNKYFKAYDFETGHTYLIGMHESKMDAIAYCSSSGMKVIPQTVVPLELGEYNALLIKEGYAPIAEVSGERYEVGMLGRENKRITEEEIKPIVRYNKNVVTREKIIHLIELLGFDAVCDLNMDNVSFESQELENAVKMYYYAKKHLSDFLETKED